jgi:hypothetical protein
MCGSVAVILVSFSSSPFAESNADSSTTSASTASCRFAEYAGGAAADYIKMELDGTELTSSATLESGVGGTTQEETYFRWCDASFGEIDVAAGEHTLVITTKGHANLDCLYFDVVSYGEFAE